MVGETFKYKGKVWIVLPQSSSLYPEYRKCMSTDTEIKHINVKEVKKNAN